ncbi:peptidyl-tRNA hydrolase [Pelagirhabdus alkalitolerans]|uniref:Peptidyl-tRNA hydrolase n=1 Tax=Pelagirhabdus alkalitolerans TaxID=1612202 RepID=A0A1G6MJW8_9BACI|nr:aminoacyl-tRNA hydrolase [Pelagirhabdus alkalitolerans]SDC55527.1 peptidyl-tRNA hydrolase [Pelagirhabdus alkalitolerans]
MKCIVGLGNPGLRYAKTRHNIGFMVIDELIKRHKWSLQKNKFKGHLTKERVSDEQIILLKPQTYMNRSGESIKELMDFYQLEPEDVLVIYDDLDLPTGKIRLRQTGGHGGHNGIRSIIDQLQSKQFNRLRMGIDRPKESVSVVDHVLGKFPKSDKVSVDQSIQKAADACETWFEKSFQEVMNEFN